MIIILSQKIDTDSSYLGDDIYKVYHYPARYKNQIHTGDSFVYYQGNRYNKAHRYYFGSGRIGKIWNESDDYYAELVEVQRFENKVPIYLPDGGYIEQLGYDTVRKSVNPPWQSSIRPLSQKAYDYIMNRSAGTMLVADCKEKMKKAIQDFYLADNKEAVLSIIEYAKQLADYYELK